MSKKIRINQVKVSVNPEKGNLDQAILHKLHKASAKIDSSTLPEFVIVKKSIDARDKTQLLYIYTVEFDADSILQVIGEKSFQRLIKDKDIMLTNDVRYSFHEKVLEQKKGLKNEEKYQSINQGGRAGSKKLKNRPVIIGTGPAGLFCGYELASAGYNPILIERGSTVENRIKKIETFWKDGELDPNSNIQFGEGGAGTFSDGKLNSMIKDKSGRIQESLRIFVEHGADPEIQYTNKPHIGTDHLQRIIPNIRKKIIELGGAFLFDTTFVDFKVKQDSSTEENKTLQSIIVKKENGNLEEIPCEVLVLAIGHSSRDTIAMLYEKNIPITPKAFAVGVRIQHPASMIQESQYGTSKEALLLPPADYKLTHQAENGRSVYSFCMCPGGFVVNASSEKESIAINGMSYHDRDSKVSNSAIVVNVTPADFESDHPLAGIAFQRKLEKLAYQMGQGSIPVQLFKDYKEGKISDSFGSFLPCIRGTYSFADINKCLPEYVNNAIISGIASFDNKIAGFARGDAIICGVESRTSSPVRIERNVLCQTNVTGIYPCGEGAGYAGGITSAAVDGIKIAEQIAACYEY